MSMNGNSSNHNGNGNGNGFSDENQRFKKHLERFTGEVVTIFTASGGVSGCGFTGVLMDVECDFVSIIVRQGIAPTCPFENSPCGECGDSTGPRSSGEWDQRKRQNNHAVGSVCDIPIDKIVAFCHNAV